MKIEIWFDVICPWCYIGKRRFETALAGFAQRNDVQVIWRSFELDATAPRQLPGTLVRAWVRDSELEQEIVASDEVGV